MNLKQIVKTIKGFTQKDFKTFDGVRCHKMDTDILENALESHGIFGLKKVETGKKRGNFELVIKTKSSSKSS
jgi:hypothetical protein